MDTDEPSYVLGVNQMRSIVMVAWFALSMAALVALPRGHSASSPSSFSLLPFSLTFNTAGLLNVIALAVSFSVVFPLWL